MSPRPRKALTPSSTLRMPENILILSDWRLAAIVDDTMPPRDPNGDDDEEEEDEKDEKDVRTRRGTMSRQSSGNPNPKNSRQPL